ncbi:hypothetical protein [Haloglomus litoreum]|uniref:hypothetical protein n=1 Tax=Haloglomus litoreum TaxID=3034026 RepID=UPI0023E829A8|nr:hypothetical protein [Haloglomus sp. DT116]
MNEAERTRRTIRRCTAVLVLALAVTTPNANEPGTVVALLAGVWLIVDYLVQWLEGGTDASRSEAAS